MTVPNQIGMQAIRIRASNQDLMGLSIPEIEVRLVGYAPTCVVTQLLGMPEVVPLWRADKDTVWSDRAVGGRETLIMTGDVDVKRIATEVFQWLHEDEANLILPRGYEIDQGSLVGVVSDLALFGKQVPLGLINSRIVLLDREHGWAAQEFLGEVPLVRVEVDRKAILNVPLEVR